MTFNIITVNLSPYIVSNPSSHLIPKQKAIPLRDSSPHLATKETMKLKV